MQPYWTFPRSQVDAVEELVEEKAEFDTPSEFVREALSEKLGDYE